MAEDPIATEAISFPTDRTHLLDPPDQLAQLREDTPLCPLRYPDGQIGWLVTSHALARRVLRDSRFGRDGVGLISHRTPFGDPAWLTEFEKECEAFGTWRPLQGFIFMDPPEHTRYRRLLAPYFTARRMAEFQPRIEAIVADRLDAMEQVGPPIDLVSSFAAPVSLASQCALLGVPADEATPFLRLSTLAFQPATPASDVVAAWRAAWEYVRSLVERKRLEPADDVISDIAGRADLSDDEITDTAFSLFQGGLEATGDMLALGAFVLLCSPPNVERLRKEPSIVKLAVEELLRYVSINHVAVGETALEDVELDGKRIKAGETITVSLAAANRDPAAFDRPNEFDVTRPATGSHLAFAQGIHMCIGQHLARLELQVGLTGLIGRFPTLHLTVPAEEVPVHGLGHGTCRIHSLAVGW
jgi:cytochrome P450